MFRVREVTSINEKLAMSTEGLMEDVMIAVFEWIVLL
jgi:hypothetical protein